MKTWFVLVSALLLTSAIDAQTVSSKTTANCIVRGRIVQQPGEAPIRKANIRLFTIGAHAEAENVEYSAVTDAEGRFELDDVTPGTYRVTYDHAGFLDSEKRHRGDGMLLSLKPGQDSKDLLFHMAPAAVITGKVLDSDGDPLSNVSVAAVPYPRNPHAIGGFSGAETNELGEFRIGGVTPKQYVLVAQPLMQLARVVQSAKEVAKNATVYATTYYPSTIDQKQAVPLTLHAGDEVQVNIQLVLVHSFHIRGEFTNIPAGAIDTSAILRPLDDLFMADIEPWSVDRDGHFEIRAVLPGSYAILVTFSDGKDSHTLRGDQTIHVNSSDIDGLRVAAVSNGDIRGQLRMESGKRIDWSQLGVNLYSDQESSRKRQQGSSTSSGDTYKSIYWDEESPRADVKSNGSFEMKDVPADTYRLQVVATDDSLANYFVKTVNTGGKDVNDSGFATTGTTQLLDIVVSANGATIEGTVLDDKSQPAPYIKIITIPDAKRRERKDLYYEGTTDAQGHFRLRGLNPGEYQVMALDEGIDEEVTESDFVQAHEALGQAVSVGEGEHKTVVLKLTSASGE